MVWTLQSLLAIAVLLVCLADQSSTCGHQSPVRHPSEHVTVTVVMYNVITGGVPSVQDVLAAIDDLEELYQACVVEGRLSESAMDFMKAPLTQNICPQINEKLQFQPPSIPVQNYDVFPM